MSARHRSIFKKIIFVTSINFRCDEFLESIIAMNFSNTSHLALKWKVPTIAMNNPPVNEINTL